jgi:hypothetical protein
VSFWPSSGRNCEVIGAVGPELFLWVHPAVGVSAILKSDCVPGGVKRPKVRLRKGYGAFRTHVTS